MQESFYTIDPKWIPILVIYAVVMAVSLVVFRIWYKRYKSIPDKQVTAKLKKTSDYFGMGETNDGMPSSYTYSIAKYEYYLNGNRHTIKLKCQGSVSDEVVLYYKKGRRDVRLEKKFTLPIVYKYLFLLYFVIGIALITVGVSQCLGYQIL